MPAVESATNSAISGTLGCRIVHQNKTNPELPGLVFPDSRLVIVIKFS